MGVEQAHFKFHLAPHYKSCICQSLKRNLVKNMLRSTPGNCQREKAHDTISLFTQKHILKFRSNTTDESELILGFSHLCASRGQKGHPGKDRTVSCNQISTYSTNKANRVVFLRSQPYFSISEPPLLPAPSLLPLQGWGLP